MAAAFRAETVVVSDTWGAADDLDGVIRGGQCVVAVTGTGQCHRVSGEAADERAEVGGVLSRQIMEVPEGRWRDGQQPVVLLRIKEGGDRE